MSEDARDPQDTGIAGSGNIAGEGERATPEYYERLAEPSEVVEAIEGEPGSIGPSA